MVEYVLEIGERGKYVQNFELPKSRVEDNLLKLLIR